MNLSNLYCQIYDGTFFFRFNYFLFHCENFLHDLMSFHILKDKYLIRSYDLNLDNYFSASVILLISILNMLLFYLSMLKMLKFL